MATNVQSLLIALGVYSAICVGLLLAFSFFRLLPLTKRLYAPKRWGRGLWRAVGGQTNGSLAPGRHRHRVPLRLISLISLNPPLLQI